MLRALIQVLLFPLPWGLRRHALRALFGYEIHPTARIGCSVILAKRCVLHAGARVRQLTLVKNLELLEVRTNGRLGNLNWVTGFPLGNSAHFQHETDRFPGLVIEEHAAVTNRHYIDCTDRVVIGAFSTLGGFWTQILTHSIDMRTNRQSCKPITVGAYCFVGTGCVLLKGSALPERSILGAGSVLSRRMEDPGMLYSGVPAVAIREIEADKGYFVRETGFVH